MVPLEKFTQPTDAACTLLSILLANDNELKQSYIQNDRKTLDTLLTQKLATQNLNRCYSV